MTAIAAGSITSPPIPSLRAKGYGRAIMNAAEDWLRAAGVAETAIAGSARKRQGVAAFYQSIGYAEAQTIVFAKWLDGRGPTP